MIPDPIDFGKIAYEAYGTSTKWRTYNDKPMPKWEELTERIQVAWRAAAKTVAIEVRRDDARTDYEA